MSLDLRLIDKRVVERSIELGRVDRGEYEAMLQELPDLSGEIMREDERDTREPSESAPSARAEGQTGAEAPGL